jgi:hypothetical protein
MTVFSEDFLIYYNTNTYACRLKIEFIIRNPSDKLAGAGNNTAFLEAAL